MLAWLNSALRVLSPFAFTLVFTLLSYSPFKGDLYGPIFPNLALPGLFLWTLWAPRLMPIWAGFFIGVVTDIISGVALGTFALTYVILQTLLGWRSIFSPSLDLNSMWFKFLFFSIFCSTLIFALVSLISGPDAPISMIAMHTLLTAAIFPLFYFVNSIILGAFLEDYSMR